MFLGTIALTLAAPLFAVAPADPPADPVDKLPRTAVTAPPTAAPDGAETEAPPGPAPESSATSDPWLSPEAESEPSETTTAATPPAKTARPAKVGEYAAPPSTAVVTATANTRKPVPIRWRFDVAGGLGVTRVTDPAFLGLSESRAILGAAPMLRFDWRVRPDGFLFAGAGVKYRGTRRATSIADGAFDTRLHLDEAVAFARVSLMPIEGIDLFADLGVGPSVARVRVTANGSDATGSQRDVLVTADAAAGLSLYLRKSWLPRKAASRMTAGVTGSLGYTIRNALTIDPTLSREDDAITTESLPLGDVVMRGLSWRLGIFVRFM
ncbi:MAG: hypothetical protein AAF721_09760 [Myxococcota bacterium]